jgi:hypothetical protein
VKKKLALMLAATAGVLSLLVPMTSQAAPKARSACVIVNGPGGFHLQVGYAPNGPSGCKVLH